MTVRVIEGPNQRVVEASWSAHGEPDAHVARLLKQVRRELEAGAIEFNGTLDLHRLDLEPSEYGLADDQWEKQCPWQHENGRDLYCTAIQRSNNPDPAIHDLGDHTAGYETDLGTCESCQVPDERLLCAGYSHVKMATGASTGSSGKLGHPIRISRAACRLGNDKINDPTKCRPGLNHCWHQLVAIEPPPTIPGDSLHVLEAFDFLDSEWRHQNPGKPLVIPTSIAEAARLTGPVRSRTEFADHVVRVGELLQKLKVDGNLFEASGKGGALERLDQWCQEHYPEGREPIERLTKVNGLRNALSHKDPPKLEAAMAKIGIDYPPESWGEAWSTLAGYVETALRDLRRAISATEQQQP